MTATTAPASRERGGCARRSRMALVVRWRNLKRIPRIPELAIFAVIQSIMFVLLFAFVFGGAIPLPGYGGPNAYREYLMPGIFAQTIAFASATTAIGMTDDMAKGHHRPLPVAAHGPLGGADRSQRRGHRLQRRASSWCSCSPASCVGWRVHTGILEFLAGVALLLLFAFAMSWIGIWLGLSVPTVEVGQQVSFTVIFPITFISNAFVPIQTMPTWLQPFAEWNPVSTLTAATRELWGNPNPFATGSFPSENPILVTLLWVALILVVFVPLGVRKYRGLSR